MSVIHRLLPSALLIAALSSSIPSAAGAESAGPTKITLHPQAEPQPAFKYRLLPDFNDRIDGNAVVYLGMVKAEETPFFANRKLRDDINRWQEEPLEDLRKVEDFLSYDSGPLYYFDQASRCNRAEWQLPIGREPYLGIQLPAVQEARQFSRILAAHSRIELARGNLDRAIKDYRISFALGRHLSRNETLVGSLAGTAICENCATWQIETFIQQPHAPNLFWALSNLPVPLIDFRNGADAELHSVELSFPEVRDLDAVQLNPEQWRERLLSLMVKIYPIGDEMNWQPTSEYLDKAMPRLLPQAKKFLIDHGVSSDAIEKMADAQIILLDLVQRNNRTRQEAEKWFFLPYPISSKGLLAVSEQSKQEWKEGRDIIPLAQLSVGPLHACRRAQVRLDRKIAALRVFEALRIYAASHEGRLPNQLAEITEVPIPNDPVAEQPFEYRLSGDTAVLTGPELTDTPLTYEITMAKNP